MAVQAAIPATSRVNHRVPSMSYASDVDITGQCTVDYGTAYIALNAAGILGSTSIATAVNTTTLATTATRANMGRYGRNVTCIADGAATSAVTVYGYDYLGQAMAETMTLNGAAAVLGLKAFAEVTRVTAAVTSARSITVGWGDKFGLPYKVLSTQILGELVSQATPTAGAVVAGVDTQTLTSGDPRGTYAPQASFISDGARTHMLTVRCERGNLHGSAHVIA